MAFTKVLGPGIHTLSNITSHNIHSSGIVTAVSFVGDGSSLTGIANTDFIVGTAITMGTGNFTGNLTVGGVLTYEDVKNVDSIGVVTARNGIECNSDISIISTGDANLNLVADTGNNNEASVPTINFTQDGGVNVFKVGVEGNAGDTFTGSTGNTPYLITTTGHGGMDLDFGTNNALRMKLTDTDLRPAATNTYDLGTNSIKWRDIYVDNFKTTTTGFEAVGTQFKFSDTGDTNVIINADTDNNNESHHPSLSFKQDGAVHVLDIGVNGDQVDYTGATHNFAYVKVGGHGSVGLEIATSGGAGNAPTKRLTIDHDGHTLPGTDSSYNIGSNTLRFANLYVDNIYGRVQDTTFTSAVTIDVNGTDDGATTLLTLDNYIADIGTEYTWIDFTFRDSNANATPQVKIGAQVQDPTGNQTQEGTGDFVVQCGVDGNASSNTMTEMFRCSHDTKITSVHHHPQSDSSFDLGTNTVRWRNVYADTLYGDGSNLTGITQTTINSNADNRVITGSGTANTLNAESTLTYDGTNLDLNADNKKLRLGGGPDIELYTDGSNSFLNNENGNWYIHGSTGSNGQEILIRPKQGEQSIRAIADGAVELYHNNNLRLATAGNGVNITGYLLSTNKVYSDEFVSYTQSNSHSMFIKARNAVGTEATLIKGTIGGAVELYHNGSKKLETSSLGATITGRLVSDGLDIGDSESIRFGTGYDMNMYHDGSNGVINNGTGNFYIFGGNGAIYLRPSTDDEHGVVVSPNSSVQLYHNGNLKLETGSSGVQVTGALNVTTTMHIPDGGVGMQIGNSNDMIMYHNGSNSFIQHQGTGSLYIDSLNNSADIYIRSRDNLHLRTNQNAQESVVCVGNGGVILYNAGSQKFTTNANGIAVTGRATFPDGNTNGVVIGDSGDVRLFHNGSHTYLENDTGNFVLDNSSGVDMYINSGNDIYIRPQGTEDGIKLIGNGAVELYHNGNRQVFTIDGGLNWQDNKKAEFGNSGDLKIYHDGTANRFDSNGLKNMIFRPKDTDVGLQIIGDGAVELYHNGTKRFETTSNGNRTNGELLYLGPNNTTNFVHSGGNLSMTADTNIYFVADCNDTSGDAPAGEFIWGGGSSTNTDSNQDFTIAEFGNNGAPRNYYMILDESSLRPANNNNLDLGGSSNRWKTIYTMDLELSNKGSSNSVDGTWGDWTLQEGENDIYMINNRTGKKFKIKMEAVD